MRKIFSVFIFLFFFYAFLFSNSTIKNTVIIYKNTCFISENYVFLVKKGINHLSLKNFPLDLDENDFFIDYKEKNIIKNLSFSFNVQDKMKKLYNKKAKIFIDNIMLEGTIKNEDTEYFWLKAKNKFYQVNKKKVSYIEYFEKPFKEEKVFALKKLSLNFLSDKKIKTTFSFNYFISQIKWQASYSLKILGKENAALLSCQISIKNNTEKDYKKSKIYIVAGDINKKSSHAIRSAMKTYKAFPEALNKKSISTKSISDFYKYELPSLYDLNSKEIKTIRLFDNKKIKLNKEYIFDSSINNKNIFIEYSFKNSKKNNLGFPLPEGNVKLFIKNKDALFFVGEDKILNTPENEKIKIQSAFAFDVKAKKEKISDEKISRNIREYKYKITIFNHKKEKINVKVKEHAYGDWEILESNKKYKKINNETFIFNVKIKPESNEIIEYVIRVKY